MYKILHRLLHIPCAILMAIIVFTARAMITMREFWFENQDTINWYATRIIRDIKCLIPKIPFAIVVFIVFLPPALAFILWMITLS